MNGDAELKVRLPSGAVMPVMTPDEAEYLLERAERYVKDNALANVSDQQELDRILMLELMCYRWGTWLGQGQDYNGRSLQDASLMARDLEKYNLRIAVMKKGLGIDKPSRDRAGGEGSVADYLDKLPRRAKAMGITRNEQAAMAVQLAMQLIGLVTEGRNCGDDEERRELRVMPEDICEWIWDRFRPQMEAIDLKFRTEGPMAQRMWIRDM